MTAGIKTSEFWLSALSIVALVVLAALGDIEGQWAAMAILGIGGVYTGGRAVVKKEEHSADEALKAVEALGLAERLEAAEAKLSEWE